MSRLVPHAPYETLAERHATWPMGAVVSDTLPPSAAAPYSAEPTPRETRSSEVEASRSGWSIHHTSCDSGSFSGTPFTSTLIRRCGKPRSDRYE